jgi:hypothetical protein
MKTQVEFRSIFFGIVRSNGVEKLCSNAFLPEAKLKRSAMFIATGPLLTSSSPSGAAWSWIARPHDCLEWLEFPTGH